MAPADRSTTSTRRRLLAALADSAVLGGCNALPGGSDGDYQAGDSSPTPSTAAPTETATGTPTETATATPTETFTATPRFAPELTCFETDPAVLRVVTDATRERTATAELVLESATDLARVEVWTNGPYIQGKRFWHMAEDNIEECDSPRTNGSRGRRRVVDGHLRVPATDVPTGHDVYRGRDCLDQW